MSSSLLFWGIFNAFVLAMLWLDLHIFHKRAHTISLREATTWSLFWVFLALSFAAGLFYFMGSVKAEEFLSGYLVEKSLSLDNIFVFSVIFQSLSIPSRYQHRILFWGIIGALVLRGLMIWVGLSLLNAFHPLIYVLGAFLIYTGFKILYIPTKPLNLNNHPLMKFLKQHIPLTQKIEGQKFWIHTKSRSKWKATPLFVALILIEFSDILFAVDSVPAIFAITFDPFVVYTSNVFAILGLRSLYFVLADAMNRFQYIKPGVGLILCFVGTKMVIMDFYKIPTQWSLFIILSILGGGTLLSYIGRDKCPK